MLAASLFGAKSLCFAAGGEALATQTCTSLLVLCDVVIFLLFRFLVSGLTVGTPAITACVDALLVVEKDSNEPLASLAVFLASC